MTLFEIRGTDDLLAVRFACSPVWETLAAVRTFIDDQARDHHEPWHLLRQRQTAAIDLSPLLAVEPLAGYVPDFISPPPRVPWPRLDDQLAEIRQTEPAQIVHELTLCARATTEPQHRAWLDRLMADPLVARDLLATRIHEAWDALIAPFWPQIRTLLAGEIEQRSRTLAQRGLRATLDELHPRIRWTTRGLSISNRHRSTVAVGERGLVLMPSVYTAPHVSAVVDEPWQPTIIYPARGIEQLWQAPRAASDALARLLGRTRANVLAGLEQPLSTTALASLLKLSPAGASRHLLALRDAGLIRGTRAGHEVRYARTALADELLSAGHELDPVK